MEIKKVLFVNRRLSVGGSERVMTLLANGFAERGFEVDMVVLQNLERTYKVSEKVNIIQFEHEKYSSAKKSLKRLSELKKVIKKGNYDAVVSFMHIDSFYTLLAGWGHKNIIVSERGEPRRLATFFNKLGWAVLYPRASKLVFQTEDAKNFFPEKIQKKSYLISNPINSELPQPYIGERDTEIVAFGRLIGQKNFKMAIDAFKLLYQEHPEYKLVIYGEGPLRGELEEYIKSNNLEKCIRLPGFASDIIEKIKKAGVYISSSDAEGISNSMLEALAMGIPSVCTDCPVGGARMTIKNNENGILVPVGDTNALYEGMKKIIEDKAFAEKLSENAVKVRNDYSIERIVGQWINVLSK